VANDRAYKQLYFLLFAPLALQVAYLNLYFERRGLDHAQIGVLNSVSSICGIVFPLWVGAWADRLPNRRTAVVLLAAGAATAFPLLWFGGSLPALLLPTIFLFACRSPIIPVCDAACLDHLAAHGDRHGERYASLRLWGSVGFVVIAAAFPRLLADEATSDPLRRLLPVFVGFSALCLLFMLRARTLPATPRVAREAHPPARVWPAVLSVLRIPRLKRLFLILLLSWIANSAYYLFLSLYLDAIGVPDRAKGGYWAVGVLSEVVLMASGPWLLRRLGVRRLLLLGLAGRTARLAAFSQPLHPTLVLCAVQPLHALSFAAVHLATVAFLARTVPDRLRASGQAAVTSLVAGLGGMLGNLLAGAVSEAAKAGYTGPDPARHGIFSAFAVAAVMQVGVLAAAWLTLREPEPQPLD